MEKTCNKSDIILNEIRELRKKIDILESKIDKTGGILETHIDFIHRVFDTIKSPLFYIMNKTNNLFLLNNINEE